MFSFAFTDGTIHESLMGASVGFTPYQESFAVDPNEILRKDHSRFSEDFSTRNQNVLSHDDDDARFASQQFVQKFEPSDFIKEESNFSEDEDQMDQKLFRPIDNMNDQYFNNNNNNNSHNISPLNNNSNNSNNINNNKNVPQIIHSANSRLLNCSRMLHLSSSSSVGSSQRMIGSDQKNHQLLYHHQQSPSPGSPMNNSHKRPNNDLHLNVKLVSENFCHFETNKIRTKNIIFSRWAIMKKIVLIIKD